MSLASKLQELKSAQDQGLMSESEYQNATQSALNNLIGGVGSGLNGGGGGGAIVTASVVEPNVEMTSVVTEQPRYLPPFWKEVSDPSSEKPYYWNEVTNETVWERPQGGQRGHGGYEALRFNQPPNPGGFPHPDGGNFFWQYYDQAEICPCKYGGFCLVFWCHPCVHGYVQEWVRNDNNFQERHCFFHTLKCIFCPLFFPCFLEENRRLIERKIYMWHKERGDPRAQGGPFPHPDICCAASLGGPVVQWLLNAQNYEVIKTFQAVQGDHLNS